MKNLKKLVAALAILAPALTFADSSIRTPEGDLIQPGDSLGKVLKLPHLLKLDSQRIKRDNTWLTASYYEYTSTDSITYQISVINNTVDSIDWRR